MEVQFTPEQEAQLTLIANYERIPVEQLVRQAGLRLIEEDAEICAAIQRGIDQADRGELIDHHEVVARFTHRNAI